MKGVEREGLDVKKWKTTYAGQQGTYYIHKIPH